MANWVAVGQRIQSNANPHKLATILTVEDGRATIEWVDEGTGFYGETNCSVEELLADWTPCQQ